jgi:perosamine synthetase
MQTTKQIPFGKPMIDDHEIRAVEAVLRGDRLVHGPQSDAFERAFASFTQAPHAISLGSCTAGLHLAYLFAGIGQGDEVIVPAETHVATAHAVEFVGATPVFVDAELNTGNIDLSKLEATITSRTRAITLVHFLGVPVDMEQLMDVARRHNLFVVEDCALAVGARVKGAHVGLWGDVGCFSFYPVKHLTTAEGGMAITRREDLANAFTRLRAFGVDRHVGERKVPGMYDVTMLGYNYRMNELEAAIGVVQMQKIDGFLAARKRNDAVLTDALGRVSGITQFAPVGGSLESAYYCRSVLLDVTLAPHRPAIMDAMKAVGVGVSVYYPKPVPCMQYYREKYGYRDEQFPVAAQISSSSIALPVGPHLGEVEMRTIANTLARAIAHVRPAAPFTVGIDSAQYVTTQTSATLDASLGRATAPRTVALIGGAGFIGHNLALKLKARGHNVHVIDGLQVNHLVAIASEDDRGNRDLYTRMLHTRLELLREADIPLHVQDARDYHAMTRLLWSIQPSTIVQLAAVSHANRSNKSPHSTFDHSLRTLENALDWAQSVDLDHFIYFSSSMIYGHFPEGLVDEETPCDPLGIYGALKLSGERIVKAYHKVFGLPYTIVRPSALYGERCVSRRVGQIFIENAMAGKEITVNGDGSDQLDFTYIDDLVQGIRRVIEEPGARNETFNLTYGESRSIEQMAEIIRAHFPNVNIRYVPKDRLTPDRGTLSVEKARRIIGYEPEFPLEKGFVRYIDWYKTFTRPAV